MTKIESIFQQKSLRITPMRQLLMEHFLQESKTLGLGELEQIFPRADRTTIYRTLKTFEEKGIVHSIENGTAEVKYALCQEGCSSVKHLEKHPHFHCQKCQTITCLNTVFIPTVDLPTGFLAKEISMTIKGICRECQ